MGVIHNLILTYYIVNAVCPYLCQQVMGPAQRRAASTLPIFCSIFVIILLSQIQHADVSPLPKTDIPTLEGKANYKWWESLVCSSLIILGLWYTINEPTP